MRLSDLFEDFDVQFSQGELALNERVVADYYNRYLDPNHPFAIHLNGSARDLAMLRGNLSPINHSHDIRAILTPSGDLYFFDGHAGAHSAIKSFLGVEGLNLNLFPTHVGIGWGRRDPTQEQYDAAALEVKASRRLKMIYGPDVRTEPMRQII